VVRVLLASYEQAWTIYDDARAACAAGLHGIWLDRLGKEPDAHPNTISSLQDVRRLVSELR
jgi:FMN phosphatase YigB (HAD superfamily)